MTSQEKTFEAIAKLQEVELELHRLQNALDRTNKALDGLVSAEREACAKMCEEFDLLHVAEAIRYRSKQ
jgi:hypothetical protein